MRKSILLLLGLLVVASLLLAACGGGNNTADNTGANNNAADDDDVADTSWMDEEITLNLWSFTNEMGVKAIAFEEEYPNVDVVFTMIPMTDGEYQTKVMAAAGTVDTPDVVALEAAFVKQWVEADLLADISDLVPVAEAAEVFPFVIEVGTYDGITKGLAWQATPGAFFYRRSIATECLGTDDPAEVQEMVKDMDAFLETAAAIKECNENYFMVGTSDAMFNPFLANRSQPWIVDDELIIDPMVVEFVHFAKLMRDNDYESQASQWSEGWFAGMSDSLVDAEGIQQRIFSYFLPTWGLPYVLIPNSGDTGGDWAMISGPLSYQWGGTWLGVVEGTPNFEAAKAFVEYCTINTDHLEKWATGYYTNEHLKTVDPNAPDDWAQAPGDFVASQVVVNKIVDSFEGSELSDWLGGINSYAAFAKIAPSVNGALLTGSDDALQRALQSQIAQYLVDEITEAQMWQAWLDTVRNEFPDLILPDPPVTE